MEGGKEEGMEGGKKGEGQGKDNLRAVRKAKRMPCRKTSQECWPAFSLPPLPPSLPPSLLPPLPPSLPNGRSGR